MEKLESRTSAVVGGRGAQYTKTENRYILRKNKRRRYAENRQTLLLIPDIYSSISVIYVLSHASVRYVSRMLSALYHAMPDVMPLKALLNRIDVLWQTRYRPQLQYAVCMPLYGAVFPVYPVYLMSQCAMSGDHRGAVRTHRPDRSPRVGRIVSTEPASLLRLRFFRLHNLLVQLLRYISFKFIRLPSIARLDSPVPAAPSGSVAGSP